MPKISENGGVRARPFPPGPDELKWLEQGLRTVGFFSKLGRSQLGAVLPFMLMVECPKGFKICEEGGPGDGFYLIYKGKVSITKKGWTKPVAVLEEGEFFGEMALLFGQPRTATATTSDATQLFCLSAEDFQRMVQQHPEMARSIKRIAEPRRLELAHA